MSKEKGTPKVGRAEKLLQILAKRKWVVCIFVLLIGFVCLFKLGSKQLYLDHCVEFALYPAINKVFDGFTRVGEVTWMWTPMYQHAAGASPVYTGIMEFGMRTFGLTLFGIRIFIALIFLLIYVVLFYTVSKYQSKVMAVLITILTLLSPWGLVMLRSGGIVALGIALTVLAICLCALMFLPEDKQPKNKIVRNIIPIGAGVCTAILPYCHAGTRMFPIVIILFALIFIKKLGMRKAFQFFVPVLLIVGIQLLDVENAMKMYFNARGENLLDVAKAQSPNDIWAFALPKLGENIQLVFKYLFGLNQEKVFFDVNLADSYWNINTVFFPKFLVPFFWGGIILHIVYLFKKKKALYLVPILLIGISFIPGLMSGIGNPNLARMAVSLPFIYYFIAYSFYQLFILMDKGWDKAGKKVGVPIATILLSMVVFTTGYQIHNYYSYEKGTLDDKRIFSPVIVEESFNAWEVNEDLTVVYQDFAVFGVHSYGAFRMMGGEALQEKIDEGRLILLQPENQSKIAEMIRNGEVDVFITAQDDLTINLFPELAGYIRTVLVPPEYVRYVRPSL